jgi:hypothetical protein
MSLHSYRPLSDEAFELLERDPKVRRTFLDFLAVLQDIVANVVPTPEAPLIPFPQLCTGAAKRPPPSRPPRRRRCITWPRANPGL